MITSGCGGALTTEKPDGGTAGTMTSTGATSTGATSAGSGGAGASGGATGGGGTGGFTTTGAGGGGPIDDDWGKCVNAGECTITLATCCGSCGVQPLSDFVGVNSRMVEAARREICPFGDLCPNCVAVPDANLAARCASGRCEAFDVSKERYSACTRDSDCRARKGLGCCECGAPGDWVAVSVSGGAALSKDVCFPGTACPDCAPQPPPGFRLTCVAGQCRGGTIPPTPAAPPGASDSQGAR